MFGNEAPVGVVASTTSRWWVCLSVRCGVVRHKETAREFPRWRTTRVGALSRPDACAVPVWTGGKLSLLVPVNVSAPLECFCFVCVMRAAFF
jgi:hypothetical protein